MHSLAYCQHGPRHRGAQGAGERADDVEQRPDAALAGVIKDVVINTSGGIMKGNAQACTSWLGRKSAMYQSLVMYVAMYAPTENVNNPHASNRRAST
jgi:hypothetical protein